MPLGVPASGGGPWFFVPPPPPQPAQRAPSRTVNSSLRRRRRLGGTPTIKTLPIVMPAIASINVRRGIVPSRFNIPVLATVVTVRVVDPVADRLAGENAHLASAGKPEQLNVTAPVKPSRSVIETVIVPELPGRWIGNAVVEG